MSKTLRWGIFSVCIIVMAVCGFEMYVATEMQKLWGWLTLPFLLAFWGFFVFLRLPKYNLRWLGLSTLSGILLALGFPVSPLTLLMFVGFVPLMIVQADILKIQTIPNITRKPNIMGYAYNAIVIWNIITTFWVCNAGLVAGMIAVFTNALLQATTFWLAHKTALQLRGGNSNIFSKISVGTFTIVFWMAFEYLHLNWELSWTWLTLGNAFAQYPDWVQWYEYTGVFGGSLWILLVNSLIFIFLNKNNNAISIFKKPIYVLKVAASILIPLSISYLILFLNKKNEGGENGKSYQIVIVQPNYEPHYEKFDIPEAVQITKFLRLAQTAVDSTTDYLVFPETSFDFHNVEHWRERPIVQELQEFVNKYPKLHLVTGIDALKIYAQYTRTKPENMPSTVREYNNRDGSFTYFEVYNAATQMISGDSILPLYKKSKLVPGPEILPYKFLLGWLKPLFDKFGGTVGGLGMQDERSVFTNKDGQFKVGPVICYESIFGDYCRGYVKNGANALFVVTNDGWWDDTPGYRQHKKFASLRAIELRRPVIRSANTGSSCFVDINGHISQATDYAKDAVIKGSIGVYDKQTFYVKTGDIIGVLASLATVISLILFLLKKITTSRVKGV